MLIEIYCRKMSSATAVGHLAAGRFAAGTIIVDIHA
jgi:hypothetical protein